MIEWFRAWSKGIVVAVIIASLIEMILPNNNSKKYIKILIGIFIVYTIISPVINQFSVNDIDCISDIEDYIEVNAKEIYGQENKFSSDSYIKSIYIQNLEDDIKRKLQYEGYLTEHVHIKICDDDTYNIENIEISISEKKVNDKKQTRSIVDNIKDITIKIDGGNQKENSIINNADRESIKKMIKDNYDVKSECIQVK